MLISRDLDRALHESDIWNRLLPPRRHCTLPHRSWCRHLRNAFHSRLDICPAPRRSTATTKQSRRLSPAPDRVNSKGICIRTECPS